MKDHRRTDHRAQTQPPPDNFHPGDALERLHADLQIEAFAHAAGDAITQYPFPAEPSQRRASARIYTLVTKVANDTDAAVTRGEALVAASRTNLQRRRTEA